MIIKDKSGSWTTRFLPNSHGARFCDGPYSGREQDEVQHSRNQQCRISNVKDAWNAGRASFPAVSMRSNN
jgi:hypothetical protein